MSQNNENTSVIGAFKESLVRNNRKIRDDRAQAISEDTELLYKRKVEDLELGLTRMKREQDNMLDLSPESAQSLVLASDFDANDYVTKDLALSVKMRNTVIELEIAKARFKNLFGKEL